jgi:acetyltransferase-like isoleucine patch superfamily enzyme
MAMMLSVTGKNPVKYGLIWVLFTIVRPLPPCWIKNLIYRIGGVKIGKRVWISPHANIDPVAPYRLRIEDDSFIGWGTSVFTHEIKQDPNKGFESRSYFEKDTILKKGCFVGGFTTIRCGSVVGENSVIGSNSMVSGEIPPNRLAYGVPARVRE